MSQGKSYYYFPVVAALFVGMYVLFSPIRYGGSLQSQQSPTQVVAADPGIISILVRFGIQDSDERRWDGSVSGVAGEIQSLRNWHPTSGDRVTQSTWSFSTRREPNYDLDESAPMRRRSNKSVLLPPT